jgi:succinate dehydrogenase/fumarate reductase flavoprotein subunit
MNSKKGKNRQKSFDSSANRFMDFMQNKSSCVSNDVEDVRSSFNSINENKLMIGRNNSLLKINNANINNKISDKTIEKSLSLSEGFDLINNINKHKEPLLQEEKKNDYPEEKQKIFCMAKVDFVPKRKNELQFKKGDIIEILMLNEDGSCQGVLNGKRGLFPFNYVAKLD